MKTLGPLVLNGGFFIPLPQLFTSLQISIRLLSYRVMFWMQQQTSWQECIIKNGIGIKSITDIILSITNKKFI